jgi:hypothetical protein
VFPYDATVTELKHIFFRGVPIIASWPERIQGAQHILSLALSGKLVLRVRYGSASILGRKYTR